MKNLVYNCKKTLVQLFTFYHSSFDVTYEKVSMDADMKNYSTNMEEIGSETEYTEESREEEPNETTFSVNDSGKCYKLWSEVFLREQKKL